ncbi:hypothetical protein Q0F99_01225 [Rathayibacter oskolensis]|uniref:hypothetical protein n=1 Tax=Rathayibacter oskolensis TaxID=1891671 RepID=UPI00265E36EC|nr:hypothetical protein [Rathayibacter oskolensis]WKK71832.1 hypothetical protein Q0F99_01225 [Rathayibacter oskolensis]
MTSTVAHRSRRRGAALARESAGLLLVLAATLLVLWRLSSTPWWTYLLSEGDSLALPLLVQSVQRGEPMQWVMTSQLLLFPELPLYLVSLALAGGGSAASLVVSAFVNVAVLYLALRWLAASVLAGQRPARRVAAAVVATGLVLVLVATEGRGMINNGAFASGILFTTYYSGVVLAGLVVLALLAQATAGFDPARTPRPRTLVLSSRGRRRVGGDDAVEPSLRPAVHRPGRRVAARRARAPQDVLAPGRPAVRGPRRLRGGRDGGAEPPGAVRRRRRVDVPPPRAGRHRRRRLPPADAGGRCGALGQARDPDRRGPPARGGGHPADRPRHAVPARASRVGARPRAWCSRPSCWSPPPRS